MDVVIELIVAVFQVVRLHGIINVTVTVYTLFNNEL